MFRCKLYNFVINCNHYCFNVNNVIKIKKNNNYFINRWCSTSTNNESSDYIHNENVTRTPFTNDEGEYFRYLLRESNFINIGDPQGKIVIGNIFHVVQDDLYIDFGWKFYCVCPRPLKNGDKYIRGTKVYLRIKDLELSSRFLGSEKDLTLLEADGTITGLHSSPISSSRSSNN